MYPMHMESIGWLLLMVLWIIPAWKVLSRVGMPPALALLAAIPFVGFLVLLFVVANSPWPSFDTSRRA
jgi:hypothetical protein